MPQNRDRNHAESHEGHGGEDRILLSPANSAHPMTAGATATNARPDAHQNSGDKKTGERQPRGLEFLRLRRENKRDTGAQDQASEKNEAPWTVLRLRKKQPTKHSGYTRHLSCQRHHQQTGHAD